MWYTALWYYLRNCPSHPNLQQPPPDPSAAINTEARLHQHKDYNSLETQMTVFLETKYF